ncbi:ArnT family glycosyltransferase [Solidesulfovibrio magneticus]|uniref:ArnT family glycosyltransferase n=1 Tax=Solidesulfovibrio magneticus TaxID=184917 RepID=UPI00031A3117|nr:phospholipid carrier-dependent glycosyltransferase [Solidesulfovibrio magneticus]
MTALLLLLAYGLFAWHLASRCPVGIWQTRTAQATMLGGNEDPDGVYLPSAVHLFDARYPQFYLGTPGLTLQYALYGVVKAYYFLGKDFPTQDFVDFAAYHWETVNALARLFMALTHALTGYLVYRLTLVLGLGPRVGLAAAGLYMTSYAVLWYFIKISPESLMTVFFVLTLLLCRQAADNPARTKQAAWGGFFCGLTWLTKVHYLYALPAIMVVQLAMAPKIARKRLIVAFLAAFLGTIALGSQHIEFGKWAEGWRGAIKEHSWSNSDVKTYAAFDMAKPATYFQTLVEKTAHQLAFVTALATLSVQDNGETFPLLATEIALFAVAALGYGLRLRNGKYDLVLLLILCSSVPVLIFRISAHYWFTNFVILSIFAANAICNYLCRPNALAAAVVCVAIIHAPGLFDFIHSKSLDIDHYTKEYAPYYQALQAAGPTRNCGVILHGVPFNPLRLGGFYLVSGLSPETGVVKAFASRFKVIEDASERTRYEAFLGSVVSVHSTGYDILPTCP